MQGGLTAILLLSCAQQWPGKLLHFLTMIWFCDPLSIVPYQPLEGVCWLSSNFQSWNLGGLCRTSRVLRPPRSASLPAHHHLAFPVRYWAAVLYWFSQQCGWHWGGAQRELEQQLPDEQCRRAEGRQVQLMHYCCTISIAHLPGSGIVPETLALPLCPQVSPVASAI